MPENPCVSNSAPSHLRLVPSRLFFDSLGGVTGRLLLLSLLFAFICSLSLCFQRTSDRRVPLHLLPLPFNTLAPCGANRTGSIARYFRRTSKVLGLTRYEGRALRFDALLRLFSLLRTVAVFGTRSLLKNCGAAGILALIGLCIDRECGEHHYDRGQVARHGGPLCCCLTWRCNCGRATDCRSMKPTVQACGGLYGGRCHNVANPAPHAPLHSAPHRAAHSRDQTQLESWRRPTGTPRAKRRCAMRYSSSQYREPATPNMSRSGDAIRMG